VRAVSRGRLVALEGLDGCGKTTQLARVVGALLDAGHEVLATREPTDGEWGRKIRMMAQTGDLPPAEEELRWFTEDRQEHVQEVIAPALEAGRTVVTDRYFLSTVAYQGARGLDWREILRESEARFPRPDLVLLFEVSPELGLSRVRARAGTEEPAFERVDYLARVAEIFAAIERDYLVRVDARGDEAAVREALARPLADFTAG
jgi:dTMP kinase